MKDRQKGESSVHDNEHLDMRTAGAASTADMTGLIPANPRAEDISEYEDLLGHGGEA